MYFASKNFYTGTTLIPSIFAPLQSRNSASHKNHIIFFSPSKAKPHSEMISDAEGAKRFEVSLLLIILLVLFTGTSSVSSFHSRSADAPLHVIRQFRSTLLTSSLPSASLQRLSFMFFLQHKEIVTVARKKKLPRGFSPQGFSALIHHHIIAIKVYIKFRSVYVFYHILAYLCDEILFQ